VYHCKICIGLFVFAHAFDDGFPESDALYEAQPGDKRERECVEAVDLLAEGAGEVDRRKKADHRGGDFGDYVDDRGLAKAHNSESVETCLGCIKSLGL